MESWSSAETGRPLWQEKLDSFIRDKLADPASPHRKRWVDRSQEYNDTHTQGIIQILRKEFGELSGLRVIDVGCGNGLDAINLARAGATVTGVEVSAELIEIARLRAASESVDANFFNIDRRLDWYRKESFDAAIAVDVLEHVEKPDDLFMMCRDILRPGGLLILTTPNRWALRNIAADPHWQLFGVTLLPRPLAKPYVVKVRRILREYDMTDFIDLPVLRTRLKQSAFVRLSDNVTDAEEKVLAPSKVANSSKRKIARVASVLGKSRFLRTIAAWGYCYAFVRTWQVIAQKPKHIV